MIALFNGSLGACSCIDSTQPVFSLPHASEPAEKRGQEAMGLPRAFSPRDLRLTIAGIQTPCGLSRGAELRPCNEK